MAAVEHDHLAALEGATRVHAVRGLRALAELREDVRDEARGRGARTRPDVHVRVAPGLRHPRTHHGAYCMQRRACVIYVYGHI